MQHAKLVIDLLHGSLDKVRQGSTSHVKLNKERPEVGCVIPVPPRVAFKLLRLVSIGSSYQTVFASHVSSSVTTIALLGLPTAVLQTLWSVN